MVAQTRTVLATHHREVVIPDSGHAPHLDQPTAFRATLAEHLTSAGNSYGSPRS